MLVYMRGVLEVQGEGNLMTVYGAAFQKGRGLNALFNWLVAGSLLND